MDELKSQRRLFHFSLRKLLLWTAVWSVYLGILEWVGIPPRDAVVLTIYLGVILAVRLRWGVDRGSQRAAVVSRLFCIVVAIAIIWEAPTKPSVNVFSLIISIVVAIPVGYLFAIPACLYGYVLVSLVVRAVDWLDNLMKTKTPQDQ